MAQFALVLPSALVFLYLDNKWIIGSSEEIIIEVSNNGPAILQEVQDQVKKPLSISPKGRSWKDLTI